MSLITWEGTTATNPYLSPQTSHLQLSHPALADGLILAQSDNQPYQNYRTGQTRADGRSLRGAIRLKGDNWKKDQWECNFLALAPQVALFEDLVAAQQADILHVALIDRWIDGVTATKNVWIDIDRQYLTLVGANSWFRLQFTLLEV